MPPDNSVRFIALTLFVTVMNTGDNVHIIVPNSQIWGSAIKNVSHNATRRVDLVVGISYDDDIGKAMDSIHSVIKADDRPMRRRTR